jgi:hypothetical protein
MRKLKKLSVALLLSVATAVYVAPCSEARPSGKLVPSTGALFGAYVNTSSSDGWTEQEVSNREKLIGRRYDIDHHYATFTVPSMTGVKWDVSNGRIPMISWGGTKNFPSGGLHAIAAGKYDSTVRQWASALKSLGSKVLLRPWWEMNGNWNPWDGAHNGGSASGPATYISAWRHIHNVIVAAGATNVVWVWCPNGYDWPWSTSTTNWNHWTHYYPGDSYVDWVGIDSYNRSTSDWKSFKQLMSGVYRDYASRKPIMVAETSSVGGSSAKAQWIYDAANAMKNSFPSIAAFVWWDSVSPKTGIDWRITTSTGSLSAYRTVANYSYFRTR